jgi:hypothetical protein
MYVWNIVAHLLNDETNQLTPLKRGLFEKMMVAQMVKKISSLLWSPEFITASIRAYHLTTS